MSGTWRINNWVTGFVVNGEDCKINKPDKEWCDCNKKQAGCTQISFQSSPEIQNHNISRESIINCSLDFKLPQP